MKKTTFEEMGGTYIRHGDYLIPCLTLPEEEQRFIDRGDDITDKKISKKNKCSIKILAIIQINEYNRGYERGGRTWII